MIDIEEFLTDRPGHPLNENAAQRVRIVFDGLNNIFAPKYSRTESISVDVDGRCLSILFSTPYLSVSPLNKDDFANILYFADSAAVSPKAEDDGFSALIVLTFVTWD